MGLIPRTARPAVGLTASISSSLAAFGLPLLLAAWMPSVDIIEVDEAPERTVYVDLSHLSPVVEGEVDEIPPLELPEPELEPEPELADATEADPTEQIDPEGPLTEPLPEDSPWAGEADSQDGLADASEVLSERRPIDWEAVRARRLARKRLEIEKARAEAREEARERANEEARKARLASKCEARRVDIEAEEGDAWRVSPEVMATYVADIDEAMKLAYVDWALDPGGKKVGVEIKRVRYCNPLHQAGFRKGDVITSIEGKKVKNLAQAWAMWRRVKRADDIEVEVERNGQRRTFRYRVG